MRRVLMFLLLVGCAPSASPAPSAHSPSAHSPSAHSPSDDAVEESASADVDAAPPSARIIARLLRAFHARDLPDRVALHAHPDAERALIWLSDHDPLLLVRARALQSLRFFASSITRAHLASALEATHPKLAAAAVVGTGGLRLDDTNDSTGGTLRAALAGLRHHPDPRVRRAVADRLGGVVVSPAAVGPHR